jgi:hypothetical protein
MELLGDLERAFASTLYPLRVPLAVLAIAGVVALLWVARRRGWFAAARRHPARSGIAIAVVVAVALPVGWYVASPLFIRTELQELPPAAVLGRARANGIGRPEPSASAAPASSSTPDVAPGNAHPSPFVRSGTFSGADEFHRPGAISSRRPGRHTLRS